MRPNHRRLEAGPSTTAGHSDTAAPSQTTLDCASTVTSTDAQALHDAAAVRGKWLIWTLSDTDREHLGKHVARAHEADHHGGKLLPGALVANTLAEVRAKLPAGLTRLDRTSALPPDVIETWD